MQDASRVRVGETTYGQGVFANQTLNADEKVGDVTGRVIDDADHSDDYCIDLDGTLSLEPAEPFRFLNHSCEPNCEFALVDPEENGGFPTIELITLRPIADGEELTIDYAWVDDSPIHCLCATPSCRGWIMAV